VPAEEPAVVPGLDPAVDRVLAAGGRLERVSVADLTMFRPEIARVLGSHGVVLAVPVRVQDVP
jgi:hypothetical protein